MIRLNIDGRDVEVAEGRTILDGARQLGIDIPTLCYLEKCGPMTSCLVCIVRVTLNGRTSVVPSCGMKAVEGMKVESETPEVHDLRRAALELLLSDHVGDCLSPCARICPLGLNIPQMLRQVQQHRTEEAAATVRAALALPAILGRLCHRPCENGCRRAACDSAAAIRDVERFVADTNRAQAQPYLPPKKPATGKRVAVIGAGPAGLAAAYELVRNGHACVVFDRNTEAGGSLRTRSDQPTPASTPGGRELPLSRPTGEGRGEGASASTDPAELLLSPDILADELRDLERFGIEFRLGVTFGEDLTLVDCRRDFDAVLFAVGELAPGEAEGWGVALTAAGIRIVQSDAFLTSEPGVFATASAVRPVKQLVKAMAEGQMAAEAIGEFLAGHEPRKAPKPFSSVMGRLDRVELKLFRGGASPAARHVLKHGLGTGAGVATGTGYTSTEAAEESARCLHCDCRAAGDCRLQHYSQVYGAEFGRFPRQRREFEQHRHPGRVLFEPGKCILCGICVKIASEAAEPLGLTFVGRGFDVRVAAPLNEAFERGLQKVAVECAEACPTGAIEIASETDAHWGQGQAGVSEHPRRGCAGCGDV